MVVMEGAIIGSLERDGHPMTRVATDLGEVLVESSGLGPRGYVFVAADVVKGNSSSGSYVSVKNARVLRPCRDGESVASLIGKAG